MPFFTNPTSFRNANFLGPLSLRGIPASGGISSQSTLAQAQIAGPPPHSSHPALPHLTMLVFEAVLEVVCVSLPGYIVARSGMFTAEMQKFTANLNVAVFTPCLSMYQPANKKDHANILNSIYEAGLSIDYRQAYGTRHHPCHLHSPDLSLFSRLGPRLYGLRLLEETSQFRGCYGGKKFTVLFR